MARKLHLKNKIQQSGFEEVFDRVSNPTYPMTEKNTIYAFDTSLTEGEKENIIAISIRSKYTDDARYRFYVYVDNRWEFSKLMEEIWLARYGKLYLDLAHFPTWLIKEDGKAIASDKLVGEVLANQDCLVMDAPFLTVK